MKLKRLNESENRFIGTGGWKTEIKPGLEQYIGKPLKEFLYSIDHRSRVMMHYDTPDYVGSSGFGGRASQIAWYLADRIVKDIGEPTDNRFNDYVIELD